MKRWTNEEIGKLRRLCHKGVSNKEIAEILGRQVTEIYNKRSQLGITIEKCFPEKALERKRKADERKKAAEEKKAGMSARVKKDFKNLYNILLVEMAKDETSEKAAKEYGRLVEALINLEEVYDRVIRKG